MVAGMLIAAACGNDSEPTAVESDIGRTAVESGMPDSPQPSRGGQLVYGLEAETEDWCLSRSQLAISGIQVVRALYDYLTVPDGKGGYVPYLAKSITPNEDFTTWTIILRGDVVFHDGTALDARVVINNLRAYKEGLLFSFVLSDIKDPIEGQEEHPGLEWVDDLTLKVHTKRPWVAFPGVLFSSGRMGIMAQKQLEASELACAVDPIGSGPFKLAGTWEPGQPLRAQANENYWQPAPDGEPYPYLDAIEFRVITNSDDRVAQLHQGNINMMHTSTMGDLSGNLVLLAEEGEINLLVSQERTEVSYLMLNNAEPPFNDRDTRIAAAMAIDRDALNEEANDGYATLADGPFAPGVMGHLEDPGFPDFDLEAAKAAVAQLQADGKPTSFTLTTTTDPSALRTAVIPLRMLRAAGFDVELVVIPQPTLVNQAIQGNFQMISFRNQPGEDPDLNRVWWHGGENDRNLVNFAGFDDPEINRLLDEGRETGDPDRRREIYEAINRRFASEVFNIWTWYAPWAVAEASNVHGILGPPLPGDVAAPPLLVTGHPLHGVWIDGN